MQVSGQLHAPTASVPEKQTPVPISEKAGWIPVLVLTQWNRNKNFCPCQESNPSHAASRYTDWAMPALLRPRDSFNSPRIKMFTHFWGNMNHTRILPALETTANICTVHLSEQFCYVSCRPWCIAPILKMCAGYSTLVHDPYTAVRDVFVANLQRKRTDRQSKRGRAGPMIKC
jgi:hypothetical protein